MTRLRSLALAAIAMLLGLLVVTATGPIAQAVTPADKSEVVLVVDFSASILADKANRGRFASALDGIADRVDATTADLVAGDATISIVQFATRATDYAGCVDLRLLNSPSTVRQLADCLRHLGTAYRTGPDARLAKSIGVDTNYVAAMERAAAHLPADAIRPALILFTDGRHDVAGVPVANVQPARDRLFGARSPFALLPVGMGLDPGKRGALEEGLVRLRIVRDLPTCASGGAFAWPQVVFSTAAAAGNAVALALQDVTCTFTVAPGPTPTPAPTPAAVRGIALAAGDGSVTVNWVPAGSSGGPGTPAIDGYRVRCRADGGEYVELAGGIANRSSAVVAGLTNGTPYRCEVASVSGKTLGAWTASTSTATPLGHPAAPGKPSLTPLDHAVRVQVAPLASGQVSGYSYQCSNDGGQSWTTAVAAGSTSDGAAEIGNLTNGVAYVCRAFAANAAGTSEPSVMSDAVLPCGSLLDCQPQLRPLVGILGILVVLGLFAAGIAIYRSRVSGYVIAVVDSVHTANLGSGRNLGISFVRAVPHGPFTGIVADRGPQADIRVRHRGGGRFVVSSGSEQVTTTDGVPVIVGAQGIHHEVVLRAFSTRTATLAPGRR